MVTIQNVHQYQLVSQKGLINWLNANKISLNVDKIEMILFKRTKKPLDCQLNPKLKGKRL